MTDDRKPLYLLLSTTSDEDLLDRFEAAEAADEIGPVPKGTYIAVAETGELTSSPRSGTRGFRICYRILDGKFANRKVWRTYSFTNAAVAYTKRDLSKFGIHNKADFQRPFPRDRFICKLVVTLRTDDEGTERNEIKSVEVLRVKESETNPFAPDDITIEGDRYAV